MSEEETTQKTEETQAPEAEAAAEPETAAEEAPAEEAPAEEAPAGEAPAAQAPATPPEAVPSKRQRSQKHVPRSERRQRPKRVRANTSGRKPIVRGEASSKELRRRQERRGVVVSDSMDKTIVVKVESVRAHQRYKKVIRRSVKFHAHDEQNQAKVGDLVRIVETRPLSKTKNWRLAEVLEAAK